MSNRILGFVFGVERLIEVFWNVEAEPDERFDEIAREIEIDLSSRRGVPKDVPRLASMIEVSDRQTLIGVEPNRERGLIFFDGASERRNDHFDLFI